MSTAEDRACAHEDWGATVGINRITEVEDGPVVGYAAELTAVCMACGVPLIFRCPDAGMRSDRPAINPTGTEIRIPARPQDTMDTFGLQLPGFGINVVTDAERDAAWEALRAVTGQYELHERILHAAECMRHDDLLCFEVDPTEPDEWCHTCTAAIALCGAAVRAGL